MFIFLENEPRFNAEEGVNIYSESDRVFELLEGDFVPFIPGWRIEQSEGKNLPSLECVFGNVQEIKINEGNFFISGIQEKPLRRELDLSIG